MGKILKIGICDDNEIVVNELERHINDYINSNKKHANIAKYFSGIQLLHDSEVPDIIFLDLQMPEIDGLKTAIKLRKRKFECRIILATYLEHKYKEGYKIGAIRFVTKPFDKNEINEALDYAFGTFIGEERIQLYNERLIYEIKQINIKYFKAYDGYAEAYIKNSTLVMRVNKSLINLMEELDSRLFFRINREYLVNLTYVQLFDKNNIVIDGIKIRISRRNKRNFMSLYTEYDLNYRANISFIK